MKLILGILALLFSINCFAHKNKVVIENYGNVKIYMKTGFDYSDIDKIKLVGKLSQQLSNRLKYRDTILIEYLQDYTDNYSDDLYILEFNNSNYKIAAGIKSEYVAESNNSGLSIRIYADRIKISNVLKLVEFTIKNEERTNSYLIRKKIGYNVYEDKELLEPLISLATDDKLIDKIVSSKSDIVNELINERFLIKGQKNYGIEIYWQNDKFIFEYNHIQKDEQEFLFEINDYFYHVYASLSDVLIFVDKNSFYFLDGTKPTEKRLINIVNESSAPMVVMDFGNKLLFYPPWRRDDLSILLKDKNKVISKFE